MRLPHGDQAIVEMVKLQEYCLSPTHPRGRHKARVFAAVLGITADNAETLRDALLRAALAGDAILTSQDAFGQRYVIDFQMQGPQSFAVRGLCELANIFHGLQAVTCAKGGRTQ
jgi:hypothetical protein